MFVLVTLTYTAPIDVVAKHTDDHRAYMRDLHAKGKLVASGPFVPRTGGALLFRVEREDEIASILAGDPFHARGLASYDPKVWTPTIGGDVLEPRSTR